MAEISVMAGSENQIGNRIKEKLAAETIGFRLCDGQIECR